MPVTLAQEVWRAAGLPPPAEATHAAPGTCGVCGGSMGPFAPMATALSDSFSAHRDMSSISSEHACAACLQTMTGKPPATWRLWSVLWREDGLAESREGAPWSGRGLSLTNRAQTGLLLETLIKPPPCRWGMSLADSGQIHVLQFAPINHGGAVAWTVRLERNNIRARSADFRRYVHAAASLISAGFSRTEVENLTPNAGTLTKAGPPVWREHSTTLRPIVRSPTMDLALFMIRKDDANATRDTTRP